MRAKYVVGADGARSKVRDSIGCTLAGDQANHAWGVMDVLAVTDFPDIRTKCAIQSGDRRQHPADPARGRPPLPHVRRPRRGGPQDDAGAVRSTTIEQIIAKANEILHPYTLDVRNVAWHSVYEVGHRLTDRFDDVLPEQRGTRTPRVFITGDACHTHSAKAGQGMNVSMQDGFNLGWKLGHVLEGRSPESLLSTYSAERQVIAKNLIDFDKEWSTLMAKKPEEFNSPSELEDFYVSTAEFPAGFMTQYTPSMLIGEAAHQDLATGFPVGKRFKSAPVVRVCDTNPVHLGHHATADGRWRIYVFADAAAAGRAVAGHGPRRVARERAGLAARRHPRGRRPRRVVRREGHLPAGPHERRHRRRAGRVQARRWGRSSSPTTRRSTPPIRRRTSSSCAASTAAASWWWCARTSTWPTSCP